MITIAVIAAAIGGLIAGLTLPLLFLPLLYLSKVKRKKDIFLLLFLVYALAIGYQLNVANVYAADLIPVLSVVVPSLLLLDVGLRIKEEEEPIFARTKVLFILIISAFVIGWFVQEVFVGAVLAVFLYEFSKDHARRGIYAAGIGFSSLIVALVLVQGVLNLEGGAATQVVFIAAFSTLTALVFFWKHVDRRELWH